MSKCETCLYWSKCDEYPFDESGCNDYINRPCLEELQHFLEVEIKRTFERQENIRNPIYDGVWVGFDEARTLRRNHIRFCKTVLGMLNGDVRYD